MKKVWYWVFTTVVFLILFCLYTDSAFASASDSTVVGNAGAGKEIVAGSPLIELIKKNTELEQRIIAVQNENDKRITTILWGVGIIVTLLVIIIAAGAFKANETAKEAAKEEFHKELDRYTKAFDDLKNKQEMQIEEFQTTLKALTKTK